MHDGTGSNFIVLIPMAFILVGIALGWRDGKRAKKENRQGQKGDDVSLLMFPISSSDASSSSASSSPEVSHHCDPGSHVGSFDSGCSSHH